MSIVVTGGMDPLLDPWDPYENWDSVTVIIGTYGFNLPQFVSGGWTADGEYVDGYWEDTNEQWRKDNPGYMKWKPLIDRAQESARKTGAKVIWSHAETLAEARNKGAQEAHSNWLIFLDADDELDRNYVRAIKQVWIDNDYRIPGDIFKPSTLGVVDGVEDDAPVMIPKRNLTTANHIVIGAMVRRDWFLCVGGFRELPALEDWDLWLRLCAEWDAKVVEVPEAIYRVHVSKDSRNQNVAAHHDAYIKITRDIRPVLDAKGIREL